MFSVKKNPTKSIVEYIFSDPNSETFEFCMCNPPFYTNIQELWESRSPARPEPKNGFTGSPHELITEGGELQFCRKIIEESKIYKDKILIYTTMVGHKYNLKELVLDLKAEGIKHTTTEFCQGRVTRWGLAWTYQDYDFSKIVTLKDKSRKKNVPICFTLPTGNCSNMNSSIEKIKAIFLRLNISYKVITKRKNELCLDITALSNTWSNQRRKRRMLQQTEGLAKKTKTEDGQTTNKDELNDSEANESSELNITQQKDTKDKIVPELNRKETEANSKNVKDSGQSLVVNAIIKLVATDSSLNIEMEYLEGTAGKEGLHQIAQFIKNNWK